MPKIKIANYFIVVIIFILIIISMSFFNIEYDLDSIFKIRTLSSLVHDISTTEYEIKRLNEEISKTRAIIENTKLEIDNRAEACKNNYEILNELKMICGMTDIQGPGITIRIADNLSDEYVNDINDKIVHDLDIRAIINDLNKCGAEAIAINGKRIVSTTEIICSGPVIKVNSEVVAAPFFIKAIGDPEELIKAINSEDSYAYQKKMNGIDIIAMKNYLIAISKKYENIEFKYANCEGEGE